MKKYSFFATALLLTFALLGSGNLFAQWSVNGPYTWINTNVGIGTTVPSNASLQFGNILGNKITLFGAGPSNYGFGINNDNLNAYMPEGNQFSIRINGYTGPERFIVKSDGSVGLGGAVPANARLQFDNTLGNKIMLWSTGVVNYGFGVTDNNLAAIIPSGGANRFSVRTDGYNGAEKFIVTNEGNVSIGSRLYVGATGTEGGYALVQFKNVTSNKGGIVRSSLVNTDIGNAPLILEAGSLYFSSNNAIQMTMNSAGNMGLGTGNLTYKLNVNGTIRSKEVRVESNWADYVFAPDYTLRPLAEVEAYIQQNQHLPDVTSADDIQKDGLQVGEQMTQMMRKIEELTLYVIDLKKENTKTQTENADLKKRLEKMEK